MMRSISVTEYLDITSTKHAARIIGQEQQDLGKVIGSHPCLQMRRGLPQHLRIHRARADGAYANMKRLSLHRENLGQTGYPSLRNIVRAQSRKLFYSSHARERRKVDNDSRLLSHHNTKGLPAT